jgi:hypothetical protein
MGFGNGTTAQSMMTHLGMFDTSEPNESILRVKTFCTLLILLSSIIPLLAVDYDASDAGFLHPNSWKNTGDWSVAGRHFRQPHRKEMEVHQTCRRRT